MPRNNWTSQTAIHHLIPFYTLTNITYIIHNIANVFQIMLSAME